MVNGGESGGLDGLENSPFGELFKNDPRMKEFFRMRPGQQQPMPRAHGMGSGFIIDSSGIILTANHVVAAAEEVKFRLHDARGYIATDIKTDHRSSRPVGLVSTGD